MTLDDTQRLLDLVGAIYDAAIDASSWPHVLVQIRDFVEGEEATLFWKNLARHGGSTFFDTGRMDRRYIQLYFDKYIRLDPSTTVHFFAEIDEPVSQVDFADTDEFRQSQFYKEWVQPQGFVDFITTAIDKSSTSVAMLGVFRHERHGLVCDETRRRMRSIAPHVRRAVLIGRMVDLKVAEASRLADAVDGLAAGMLLLDESAEIMHANGSAEALLAEHDIIHAQSGRLVVRDALASQELAAVLSGSASGDGAVGARGIAIAMLAPGGSRYVGHVLPLVAGKRRSASVNYAATAALFIRKAELDVASAPEIIAKAFKLTPAELRVLLAIVKVGGAPEVAAALGVSEPTVKTHLQRVYAKTGTARQADLVKLMAQFADPTQR